MKRRFALPIVIAALLHAGLLWGLRGHQAEIVTATLTRPVPPKSDPPKIEVTLPLETEAETAAPAKGPAAEAPPSLAERPELPRVDDFQIEITKHEDSTRHNLTVIPPGAVGIPSGDKDGFGKPDGSIVRARDLDGGPRARYQSRPNYPTEARRAGLAGEVLVDFVVDETGAVREVRVVRSSDRAFEEPAMRAVAQWRFEPGRRNGSIVRFRMSVPVVFTLAEN